MAAKSMIKREIMATYPKSEKISDKPDIKTLETNKQINKKFTQKKETKTSTDNDRYINDGYIIIDYPREAENITSPYYAVRIGASNNGYVEVSFNDSEWLPCRFNSGYWWFDWMYFNPGEYHIAARLVTLQGNAILETDPRKCKVC